MSNRDELIAVRRDLAEALRRVDALLRNAQAGNTKGAARLVQRRLDVAFDWRCAVPAGLHQEFVAKLGGDDADERVRQWYRDVADYWPEHQPIAEDDWAWWRARWAEAFGSGGRRTRADLGPAWIEWTCAHDPHCDNRAQHERRCEREAR